MASLYPIHPKPCNCSHSFTKHANRAYHHDLMLMFSRLWNSGAVVKSVAVIFILKPSRR